MYAIREGLDLNLLGGGRIKRNRPGCPEAKCLTPTDKQLRASETSLC